MKELVAPTVVPTNEVDLAKLKVIKEMVKFDHLSFLVSVILIPCLLDKVVTGNDPRTMVRGAELIALGAKQSDLHQPKDHIRLTITRGCLRRTQREMLRVSALRPHTFQEDHTERRTRHESHTSVQGDSQC